MEIIKDQLVNVLKESQGYSLEVMAEAIMEFYDPLLQGHFKPYVLELRDEGENLKRENKRLRDEILGATD
jgi:hypothetical protein